MWGHFYANIILAKSIMFLLLNNLNVKGTQNSQDFFNSSYEIWDSN